MFLSVWFPLTIILIKAERIVDILITTFQKTVQNNVWERFKFIRTFDCFEAFL
jgi:hypothetical protein